MFEKNKGDLHCHLNGSFSMAFLKRSAEKNNCITVFDEYKQLREQYLKATKEQPEDGYNGKLIAMI